ncbi:MAG: FHA domain-containing protein, partial [Myxococcales bacterium]|nr:FHA domain-containing protein [Myxococcales bacterium]
MANTNNNGGNYGNDGDGGDFHSEKTVMMGAEARAALARAMLHVDAGPDKGFSYPVAGAATTVGRGSSCDIVLNDQHVSRQHFRLEMRGGAYVLVDSGSGNGTVVNGQKAAEVVLQDGAEIALGSTKLRFVLKGAPGAGVQTKAAAAAAPKPQQQQAAATTQKAPPPKAAPVAAQKSGKGGLIAVLLIVVLLVGAAAAAAGDLVFGWWSIPKLRTVVPASWIVAGGGGSSSSNSTASGTGSDCEEYVKKTCELAQGNETACAAAKTAAANMTADQCKLALGAMGGIGGGAADSEECKEYIQKTCELAQGNETACAAAKTAAANMTAEQCKLAVSAMAGAQVPAGGAADS